MWRLQKYLHGCTYEHELREQLDDPIRCALGPDVRPVIHKLDESRLLDRVESLTMHPLARHPFDASRVQIPDPFQVKLFEQLLEELIAFLFGRGYRFRWFFWWALWFALRFACARTLSALLSELAARCLGCLLTRR